jgi:hypothetical protein
MKSLQALRARSKETKRSFLSLLKRQARLRRKPTLPLQQASHRHGTHRSKRAGQERPRIEPATHHPTQVSGHGTECIKLGEVFIHPLGEMPPEGNCQPALPSELESMNQRANCTLVRCPSPNFERGPARAKSDSKDRFSLFERCILQCHLAGCAEPSIRSL